jgi:hypothetical protein
VGDIGGGGAAAAALCNAHSVLSTLVFPLSSFVLSLIVCFGNLLHD